jgi:hypothetical protein
MFSQRSPQHDYCFNLVTLIISVIYIYIIETSNLTPVNSFLLLDIREPTFRMDLVNLVRIIILSCTHGILVVLVAYLSAVYFFL